MATTTRRGVAVSRSSATAVQSVYIASGKHPLPIISGEPMASHRRCSLSLRAGWTLVAALLLPLAALPVRAGVASENCHPPPVVGVSCDTRPTRNTRSEDDAAPYGLFAEATRGWAECQPYAGTRQGSSVQATLTALV